MSTNLFNSRRRTIRLESFLIATIAVLSVVAVVAFYYYD
jgi:hypothetical protein